MESLNQKLEEKNILPNFDIVGVTAGPSNPSKTSSVGLADAIVVKPEAGQVGPETQRSLTTGIWYPDQLGPMSPSQQRVMQISEENVGGELWMDLHADDDVLTSPSPGPLGGPGGYGCAASVASALRRAELIRPEDDPINVEGVQTLLTGGGDNPLPAEQRWKPVLDTTANPESTPPLETLNLEPGDVILGYRGGHGGHSGSGAHAGIVGEHGMVYGTGAEVDANGNLNEVWTKGYLSHWRADDYTDGIVVLRAPDAV